MTQKASVSQCFFFALYVTESRATCYRTSHHMSPNLAPYVTESRTICHRTSHRMSHKAGAYLIKENKKDIEIIRKGRLRRSACASADQNPHLSCRHRASPVPFIAASGRRTGHKSTSAGGLALHSCREVSCSKANRCGNLQLADPAHPGLRWVTYNNGLPVYTMNG